MITDNKAIGKFVGFFIIDGSQKFGFMKKPNLFKRLVYGVLLGWKWQDS